MLTYPSVFFMTCTSFIKLASRRMDKYCHLFHKATFSTALTTDTHTHTHTHTVTHSSSGFYSMFYLPLLRHRLQSKHCGFGSIELSPPTDCEVYKHSEMTYLFPTSLHVVSNPAVLSSLDFLTAWWLGSKF